MPKTAIYAVLLPILLSSFSYAGNWGHWRGPTGNGTSVEANPPTEWSSTKNVKWKVEIPGRGSSSPVIWGHQVFVTTAVSPDGTNVKNLPKLEFRLLCFNRDDGKKLWEKTAAIATPHQQTHATNGFASASPCTDGEHIYAHFGSRGLFCYTMNGELTWKRDDFGKMETRNSFGEGSSPTLEGDKIIVPWDHEGKSAIFALNKLTGKNVWRTDRDEPSCWSTPLVVENGGQKQVVMNGQNYARAYDLQTGKELWRCGGQSERPIATPVSQNGIVFIGSGHRSSFMGAFRLNGTGDIKGTENVVWAINRDTPDVASPLLSSGRIYFHKGKTGQLSCVDAATGKSHYMGSRIPGIDSTYASPVAAGGHVYLTGRNGTTVVINDADQLAIISTNNVDETVDATPALVDNELFLRGEKHLFCIATSR